MVQEQVKKLLLVDGMALVYRAHFAFQKYPRRNSRGLNTSAVYGFVMALLEVLNKERPTHRAVAFDTSAPTFRHEIYTDYKAQREKQPEDISKALPLIEKFLDGMQIPVLKVDGYEADDLIGTLSRLARLEGFEILMMTPDKDFAQLLAQGVYLYRPPVMKKAAQKIGLSDLFTCFGVDQPGQLVDLLALQGDAIDNIPGVPGIGAKTAKSLLKEHGSLEELLKFPPNLAQSTAEKLRKYKAQALLSRQLATIDTEVPIDWRADDCAKKPMRREVIAELFSFLEFKTLSKRLLGEELPLFAGSGVAPSDSLVEGSSTQQLFPLFAESSVEPSDSAVERSSTQQLFPLFAESSVALSDSVVERSATQQLFPLFAESSVALSDSVVERSATQQLLPLQRPSTQLPTPQYHVLEGPAELSLLLPYLEQQSSVSLHFQLLHQRPALAQIESIALAYQPEEAYVLALPRDRALAVEYLGPLSTFLATTKVEKIGLALKESILALQSYGICLRGPFFDVTLAHYVCNPEASHLIEALVAQYLPMDSYPALGKEPSPLLVSAQVAVQLLGLRKVLTEELKEGRLMAIFQQIELPLIEVLATMEAKGVYLQPKALQKLSKAYALESQRLEQDIHQMAGMEFNISSPKQLGELLFDTLKLEAHPKKTKTGHYATGEEILQKLSNSHPIIEKVLSFREYQKLRSTYLEALPRFISPIDGRVHTQYRQAVAATGRLSSNYPNLQNIPIRTEKGQPIREAFEAASGYSLLSADYSQIELRILASFAEDEAMLAAFAEEVDIHRATASQIFRLPVEEVDASQRRLAKMANFGILYGISAFGLSQRLQIPRKEAQQLIGSYFESFPRLRSYIERQQAQARERGYVETYAGRRRYLPDISSRNATLRAFAERNAINAPIQGTAADIIKQAMCVLQRWLTEQRLKSRLILQIHDELLLEVPEEELPLLREQVAVLMQGVSDLPVPLRVSVGVGGNWLEAHS